MQIGWWEDFFSGVALDLWRQAMTEEGTRAEADFIQKLLGFPPEAKVLDVPCGEGRLSRELASRGYQMTGTDIALPFLEEAKLKAGDRHLKIVWEHRDMRNLPWQEEFDGAFCFGGSFGYFDDVGNANFLKSVARALKSGARFILDASRVAELILPKFREREWAKVGDILFLEENRYDHIQGRMDTEYTFVREGKVEKRFSSERVYTYREHCRLLEEAGFANCEGYASLHQDPFKLGSERLFLAATKKRECGGNQPTSLNALPTR